MHRITRAAGPPHATNLATPRPYVKGKGKDKGKGKHKGLNALAVYADDDDDLPTANTVQDDDLPTSSILTQRKRKARTSPSLSDSDATPIQSPRESAKPTGIMDDHNDRYAHDALSLTPRVKRQARWANEWPLTPPSTKRVPSSSPISDTDSFELGEPEEVPEELLGGRSQPLDYSADWRGETPVYLPRANFGDERRRTPLTVGRRPAEELPRKLSDESEELSEERTLSQPSDLSEEEEESMGQPNMSTNERHSLFLMSQPSRLAEELTLEPMSQPSALAEELGLQGLMSQPTGLPEMLSLELMSQLSEDSDEPMSQLSDHEDSEELTEPGSDSEELPESQVSEHEDSEELLQPSSQLTELASDSEEPEPMYQPSETHWKQTQLSVDLLAYAVKHKIDTEKMPCHPNHVTDPAKRARILADPEALHYKYRDECDVHNPEILMDLEYNFHPDDPTVSSSSRNLLKEAIVEKRNILFVRT